MTSSRPRDLFFSGRGDEDDEGEEDGGDNEEEGFSGKGPKFRSEKGLLDKGSDEEVVSSFLFFLGTG